MKKALLIENRQKFKAQWMSEVKDPVCISQLNQEYGHLLYYMNEDTVPLAEFPGYHMDTEKMENLAPRMIALADEQLELLKLMKEQ